MAAIADDNVSAEPKGASQEFTLRIRRYNPESGEAPYWDEHTIELEPHRSPSVLTPTDLFYFCYESQSKDTSESRAGSKWRSRTALQPSNWCRPETSPQ